MIKEQEIEYFRKFVINKYVDEVMANLSGEKKPVNSFAQRPRRLTESNRFKTCKKCGKLKRISSFYKHPLKKQGVFDYCKDCARKRAKELRRERRQRANNVDNEIRESA
jgi:hypothetical protein